jgi:manganese oxidase
VAHLTRRSLLAGLGPLAAAPVVAKLAAPGAHAADAEAANGHAGHAANGAARRHPGAGFHENGQVDHRANGFHPTEVLRDFDEGEVKRVGGRTVRQWTLTTADKELEVAPGVKYPAWTFNGRIPGPTLRAREGDRLRIELVNGSEHPHTIHFHGVHAAAMDGIPETGPGLVQPGERTVYEFDADPFGLHVYHCHTPPLASHIAKGLHGMFIIDPKDGRRPADELVMVMDGFDTNFDRSNEVYAANAIPFAYLHEPIKVKRGELVRLYLANMLEFDLVNSFHLHGNFFEYIPTGTSLEPAEFTDTVMQCQGQRGILEWRFPKPGKFMFHAHQSEFTELGWMGFFEVV